MHLQICTKIPNKEQKWMFEEPVAAAIWTWWSKCLNLPGQKKGRRNSKLKLRAIKSHFWLLCCPAKCSRGPIRTMWFNNEILCRIVIHDSLYLSMIDSKYDTTMQDAIRRSSSANVSIKQLDWKHLRTNCYRTHLLFAAAARILPLPHNTREALTFQRQRLRSARKRNKTKNGLLLASTIKPTCKDIWKPENTWRLYSVHYTIAQYYMTISHTMP